MLLSKLAPLPRLKVPLMVSRSRSGKWSIHINCYWLRATHHCPKADIQKHPEHNKIRKSRLRAADGSRVCRCKQPHNSNALWVIVDGVRVRVILKTSLIIRTRGNLSQSKFYWLFSKSVGRWGRNADVENGLTNLPTVHRVHYSWWSKCVSLMKSCWNIQNCLLFYNGKLCLWLSCDVSKVYILSLYSSLSYYHMVSVGFQQSKVS